MWSILIHKSPGPDGFGRGLYRQAWDVIKKDVVASVQLFFQTGKLHQDINAANLTLIPKCEHPSKATDFRPIACCGVLYKVIAKLLSAKLQAVLPSLINQNQSAFVSGRYILHNVLIGVELVRLYNRTNASPRALMKLDIRKAYDSVNWKYLQELLKAYKFPQPFVHWISTCVQTVNSSLIINGEATERFRGQQGLRQGDLISPLLFILVMEYLSRMFSEIAKDPSFRYHPMCKQLGVTNLAFADDLLVFCKAEAHSVGKMVQVLQEFADLSGLKANLCKSNLFLSGVCSQTRQTLLRLTGF